MRAVAVTQPGEVRIVELDKPEPGPYQALVRTEAASLCNSTDSKLVAGHFPGVDRYPLVLGHESAGIVEAVGAKVRNFQIGQRAIGGLVFDFGQAGYASGWGGFSEYTLVNDHDAMVADGVADAAHGWFEVYEIQRTVAPDIPLEAAVLLCTWREVYGGFGDFQLQAGDDVVIFGAGPVGASFVKLGRLLGSNYIGVVDPVESKRARALAMGADEAFAPDSAELAELARRRAKPLDAVIDAVGSESNRERRFGSRQDGRVDLRLWRNRRTHPHAPEGSGALQLQPVRSPVADPISGARGFGTTLRLDTERPVAAGRFHYARVSDGGDRGSSGDGGQRAKPESTVEILSAKTSENRFLIGVDRRSSAAECL